MTERGGPTWQAGIQFQNSVAGLYLGDLLRLDPLPARQQVTEVRVEAPVDVDDIVAMYADGHRQWIQVKLNLSLSGGAWEAAWRGFQAQRASAAFGVEDRLVLVLGTHDDLAAALRECAERSHSSADSGEWL